MKFSGLTAQDEQLLLRGAKAILSVEGEVELLDIEWDTLAAIERHLLRTGVDPRALPASAPRREELDAFRARSDEATVAALSTLWCLMPIVGGQLGADKVALLSKLALALDQDVALVADMASLVRRVTLGAKLRIFQRVFAGIFHMSMLRGVAQLAGAYLGLESRAFGRRYDDLAELPTNSFGYQLWSFYERNEMRPPGRFGAYPYAQIGPHDAHHVLAACDVDHVGELLVVPFECGTSEAPAADMLVVTLLQTHAGMQLDPSVPARTGLYVPDAFFAELARGVRVREDLLATDWDFWAYVDQPLADVRARLGIGPGGNLAWS